MGSNFGSAELGATYDGSRGTIATIGKAVNASLPERRLIPDASRHYFASQQVEMFQLRTRFIEAAASERNELPGTDCFDLLDRGAVQLPIAPSVIEVEVRRLFVAQDLYQLRLL